MNKLNQRQREAVRHIDGPLLVLAGAGSGKTRVIAHKIEYLIKQREVPPERIAAITFTNKAAREMRERVSTLLPRKAKGPWISTFHTLGLRIMRAECKSLGYRPGFSILDSGDCANLLADLMRRDQPGSDISVYEIQNHISGWKYALIPPDKVVNSDFTPAQKLALRCYGPYCEALRAFNAVDFDDLIIAPVGLLQSDASVLERWRGQIDYLLVDEYQDTNLSQYELVRLLAGGHERLTVVGDDDQSIYAWRGARPENMVQLASDFPALKVVKLEQNYRCSGIILKAANSLIANNPHIYPKTLWCDHGFGDKIRVVSRASEHDEVEWLANDILHRRLVHSLRYGDFAVLMRSNHQARLFEHAFRERAIPYVVSGGRSFFDFTEIKDCVCYLRLLANPSDNNALLRVINTPRRAIGPATVKILVEVAANGNGTLADAALDAEFATRVSPQTLKRTRAFIEWLNEFQRLHGESAPPDAFAQLLADVGYDDWLEQTAETPTDAERKRNNVAELAKWIKRIHEAEESRTTADVVAALTLFDIADRKEDDTDADAVVLTTLHAAKGLEYPHVYLAGFEENLLPHRNSIALDTIEEERRLAYVGITRAQRTLSLSFCRSRKRFGQTETVEPSRFLAELPQDELAWDGVPMDVGANKVAGRGTLDSLKRMLKT
ncbi:MAG: UvrD-helicase domain-containing protein [Proteobacteria bacterium]|nr:UvrD-helicase domain-containing protein [Pseudomonadota bacterium]